MLEKVQQDYWLTLVSYICISKPYDDWLDIQREVAGSDYTRLAELEEVGVQLFFKGRIAGVKLHLFLQLYSIFFKGFPVLFIIKS